MENNKGYAIRLFVIQLACRPPKDSPVNIGQYICRHVNATPGNKTTIVVDEENFFWIEPEQKPVWADVVGSQAALTRLLGMTGPLTADFFNTYKEAIHQHFQPKTLSLELARILHAPNDELHPSETSKLMGGADNTP